MIIYDGKFDSETVIHSKIDWAYKSLSLFVFLFRLLIPIFYFTVGYKTIALAVEIDGENIPKMPTPPKIESKQIKVLTRLTVRIADAKHFYSLVIV